MREVRFGLILPVIVTTLIAIGCQSPGTNTTGANNSTFVNANANFNTNTNTTTSSGTVITASEPEQYQANVKLSLETLGSAQKASIPTLGAMVARSGADRVMEFALPTGEKVIYLDKGGVNYVILGVCDNDCSDLDLRLFDPNGREVASDLLTDDNPVVNVTPRRTGTYTVRAIMTTCSSQPCRYGIGVYGR